MLIYAVQQSESSICCCSVAKLCLTLCDPMECSTPGFPVLHHLLEFAQTHVHWVGDAIQPSHPRPLPSLPVFSLPSISVFTNESSLCTMWPKYWSFSNSPSNEYSGLIFFRTDWFYLLAVQELSRIFSSTTVQKHHSLALILLYGQTLTSVQNYWKNHSFDHTDLCWWSNVSAF